jgi:hydantoinase/carbamoylase family amidase
LNSNHRARAAAGASSDRQVSGGGGSISESRIADNLRRLEVITATPGDGITRLAFSDADATARALVVKWMRDAELEVRVDAAGNIIGRRNGSASDPAVLTGSHLDSVPNGGNYDGVVGVIAAIECARVLAERRAQTRRPIEFVCFASEEAPRFAQSSNRFGSRAMAGLIDPELPQRLHDSDGTSLAEAMRRVGLDPSQLASAKRDPSELFAIVELHIEQGTLLAEAKTPVGIVTRITGTTRFKVDVIGASDHSGGTPMTRRRDALAGAAEMILAIEAAARDLGGDLVATVGVIEVRPGAISVVPGLVTFGVDVRDVLEAPRRGAVRQIMEAIETIASRRALGTSVSLIRDDDPVVLSASIQDVAKSVAARLRIPSMSIPSHTGHDAASLSAITEAAMLMVRNRSGKSHAPDEHVDVEDIVAGTRVLCGVVEYLAGA